MTAARAHLARVAPTFGVAARDLRLAGTGRVAGTRRYVRFQQTRAGLPVFAGQLVTVLDAAGACSRCPARRRHRRPSDAPTRTTSPPPPRPAPPVGPPRPGTAWTSGRCARPADPVAARPVAGRPAARPPVSGRCGGCRSGRPRARRRRPRARRRPDRPGRPAPARGRRPSTGWSATTCGTRTYRCKAGAYDRVEGGPAIGVAHADQAYDLTGTTAAWYAGTLGVDLTALIGSDLGDGRKLRSTTNYCPPGECPLDNAFWSGDQMVYGAGYTSADDVVAHELTHGVTQHTAGLVYWYQSGAINESMSDVLGELADQADGVGTTARRCGGGSARTCRPTTAASPATWPTRRASTSRTPPRSPLYDLALDYDDNGGVHTNSGVRNKAAYLITDGTAAEPDGAFAGRAFAGIGTARAATLYWATLQMLTPGSDFQDLSLALAQSCSNLAFSPDECATVSQAVEATGLNRGLGPSEPRRVVARGGPSEALLSWAAPAAAGSAPLTSYAIAISPPRSGNDDLATVDPSADGWVVTGLSQGVDYTFRVFAVSPDGTSPSVTRRLTGSAVTLHAPSSVLWSRPGGRLGTAGQPGRHRAGRAPGLPGPPRRRHLGLRRGGLGHHPRRRRLLVRLGGAAQRAVVRALPGHRHRDRHPRLAARPRRTAAGDRRGRRLAARRPAARAQRHRATGPERGRPAPAARRRRRLDHGRPRRLRDGRGRCPGGCRARGRPTSGSASPAAPRPASPPASAGSSTSTPADPLVPFA